MTTNQRTVDRAWAVVRDEVRSTPRGAGMCLALVHVVMEKALSLPIHAWYRWRTRPVECVAVAITATRVETVTVAVCRPVANAGLPKRLCAAVVMLGLLGWAQAQFYAPDRGAERFEAVAHVVARTEVRNAPPHGLWRIRLGDVVTMLDVGTRVEILARITYSGFGKGHIWYRIAPLGEDASAPWWLNGDDVELEP